MNKRIRFSLILDSGSSRGGARITLTFSWEYELVKIWRKFHSLLLDPRGDMERAREYSRLFLEKVRPNEMILGLCMGQGVLIKWLLVGLPHVRPTCISKWTSVHPRLAQVSIFYWSLGKHEFTLVPNFVMYIYTLTLLLYLYYSIVKKNYIYIETSTKINPTIVST